MNDCYSCIFCRMSGFDYVCGCEESEYCGSPIDDLPEQECPFATDYYIY